MKSASGKFATQVHVFVKNCSIICRKMKDYYYLFNFGTLKLTTVHLLIYFFKTCKLQTLLRLFVYALKSLTISLPSHKKDIGTDLN